MELQELYGLMDRFAASGLTALEWERGEEKISLRREGTASLTVAAPAPVPVSSVPEEQEEGEVVTAPLVGVFYVAPAPEEPPYVTAGAADCVVEEVLARDGEAVGVGAPLFRVRRL